jgi:N-acyl-D-aspartate/D-glutamate deacylase
MGIDLVIRGGTVIDGSGAAGRTGDVAVNEGVIVGVGAVEDQGRQEIDARGMLVCPGFIDGHAHLDAQIFWDPLATPVSMHGVTTLVMGNCGFTLAPVQPGTEELAIRSIERAEDISRGDLETGVPWGWRSFSDYLDAVDTTPKAVNLAGYIGHSALRTFVMGERAYHDPATADDLVRMGRELTQALAAGAVGFSTSQISQHRTVDDQPVASYIGGWDEVEHLAGVLGRSGTGVLQLATLMAEPENQAHLLRLARIAGRPVHQGCIYKADQPEGFRSSLAFLERAADEGAHIIGQAHVRPLVNVIGFKVGLPFDRLPQWGELRRLPLSEQRRLLEDPERRSVLVDEALHGPYVTSKVIVEVQARLPDYENLRVLESPMGPNPSLAELARDRGTNPVDLMIDLSLAADFEQYFTQPFANQDEGAVETILRHPHTIIAQSDSGAHVSQLMDSSIPTHFLAHWVRDRQAFSWEQAIHMLTGRPAREWGLGRRGLIDEGAVADLVVIDPESVGPRLPYAVSDLPAGGTRLVQEADGIFATVVGGGITSSEGKPTDARPGRLIRRS